MDIASKEGHWVVLQNIHLGLKLIYKKLIILICFFLNSRKMVTTIRKKIRTMLGNRS
jgi:hypothetical protein